MLSHCLQNKVMDKKEKDSKFRYFTLNCFDVVIKYNNYLIFGVNEMKNFIKEFVTKALNSAKDGLVQGVTEGIKEAVKENVKAPVKKGVNALFVLPKQFLN